MGGFHMNTLIDQLFRLEQQAVETEKGVQAQKLEMKQLFNQKKMDKLADLQAEYDQKLANFISEQDQALTALMAERQVVFEEQLANIHLLANQEQFNYVSRFMEKVKALGVTGNE